MIPQTTSQWVLPKVSTYENLEKREAPVSPPRANEVLVKIHAVSLQYRDHMIAKGIYVYDVPDNSVPCSDMAGEVIAVGKDVKNWKVGDRVSSNFATGYLDGDVDPDIVKTSLGDRTGGVLTQYRNFPAQALISIPAHLSYKEAATLPCAGVVAYNALHGVTPIKAGDTVLLIGTGGVCIFALQFAIVSGATVIIISSSDEKLQIASKLGAKHVINYKTTPAWDEEVLKLTQGKGADHVIEVGGAGTLGKSINAVKMSGHIHSIGMVALDDLSAAGFILHIIRKSITLRGLYVGSVSKFRDMIRLIEAHPEATRPVIDKVFSFDEVIQAYTYLESQKHVGKIVIEVEKEGDGAPQKA